MNQKGKLEKYAQMFSQHFEKYLAKGISIDTVIYPADGEGAVFEFKLAQEHKGKTKYMPPRQTVGQILSEIPQNLVSGNISNVKFGGTNLVMENNRILIIKGEDAKKHWDGNAAQDDVRRVVSGALSSTER